LLIPRQRTQTTNLRASTSTRRESASVTNLSNATGAN
jgi:hypothetical protein